MPRCLSALAALALLFSVPTHGKTIDATLSGSWFNAAQSGHGLSVEYLDRHRTAIYWYVYSPDREPIFLTIAAQNDGARTSGIATIQNGMAFGEFNAEDVVRSEWGTVSITYHSCDSLTLEYDSVFADYGSGAIEMQRLLEVPGVKCTDAPYHGRYRTETGYQGPTDTQRLGGEMALFEAGVAVWHVDRHGEIDVGLGEWSGRGDADLQINGSEYTPTGEVADVSLAGRLTPDGFVAEADGAADPLSLTATRQASFQWPVTAGDLTGSYTVADADGLLGQLSIDASGAVDGMLDDGCSVSGTISAEDQRFALVLASLDLSGCSRPGLDGAARRSETGELQLYLADGQRSYRYVLSPAMAAPRVKAEASYTVTVTEDIVYAEGLRHESINSSAAVPVPLLLDAYVPDNEQRNRPVLMFIHGGGFRGGSKTSANIVNVVEYFAQRGFVVFSINYRVVRDRGTVPQAWVDYAPNLEESDVDQFLAIYAALRDAKAALRWVLAHADDYGINRDYVTVGGNSAGATSALGVGISAREDYRDELTLAQDRTLLTTNLFEPNQVHTILDLWGSKNALDTLEVIYGLQRFDSDSPSLFIAHGTEDPVVPYSSAEDLQAIYEDTGAPYVLYALDGLGHGPWDTTVDQKRIEQLAFEYVVEQQGIQLE